MATTAAPLPHWDMTVVYPRLDSPQFADGFTALRRSVTDLVELFDRSRIGTSAPQETDNGLISLFEEVTSRLNTVLDDLETMDTYISSFVETNTRDDLAQARYSELDKVATTVKQVMTRYVAWVGSLDVAALVDRSDVARAHDFPLQQMKIDAAHQMSPAEEDLLAELGRSAGGAWSRLHANITSQLEVTVEISGELQTLPMSGVRNLAHSSDRDLRRRAYHAEIAVWDRAALPLAASMNGIKGEVLTVNARRGWASPLAAMLHANRIDQETLDAMLGTAEEFFPDFRRYLRAKARVLGVPQLAWYDLFAPVGVSTDPDRWSFANGQEFILRHFGSYSDRLRSFAERAFAERWIDAEPRPGKADGAFCMWLRGDESRILANFEASYAAVSTLAHELGHAYHNLCEFGLTALQRDTPMTMAETASIFCETIVKEAALVDASEDEQFTILEASLQDACQVVVDISSRFRFERAVFAQRDERDLSIDELKALMVKAQEETFGDGLDASTYHPFMWAVKGHYYSASKSFYNFPYMFGLLFGLGVYARSHDDPNGFKARYDDLLAHTGRADTVSLAARFGIDLHQPAFWRSSLDLIRTDIDRFEALVDARMAG